MAFQNKKEHVFLKHFFAFLTVIWAGFIFFAVKNYFFFQSDSEKDLIPVGKFSEYINGRIIHREKERFFIIRDKEGLYALSDVCTHSGCMLQESERGFSCPCHKAVFTHQGMPVEGPVERPLDCFYIYKNRENILVVDLSKKVDGNYRWSE